MNLRLTLNGGLEVEVDADVASRNTNAFSVRSRLRLNLRLTLKGGFEVELEADVQQEGTKNLPRSPATNSRQTLGDVYFKQLP